MSNVQVLAAIELDMGVLSLLHYPDLTAGKLLLAELPDYTLPLTDTATGKSHNLHFRVTSLSSDRAAYDFPHTVKILREKLAEVVRLKNVVKLYGHLIVTPAPVVTDEYQHHHDNLGYQLNDLIGLMFGDEEQNRGYFGRGGRRKAELTNLSADEHRIFLGLNNSLCFEASYPVTPTPPHRATENSSLDGTFELGGKTWSFFIAPEHHHRTGGFPISTALNFDAVTKVIDKDLAQSFPYLTLESTNFKRSEKVAAE